jgi:hypothetical protein
VSAKCWESSPKAFIPNTRTKNAKVQTLEYEDSGTREFSNKCTLSPWVI